MNINDLEYGLEPYMANSDFQRSYMDELEKY